MFVKRYARGRRLDFVSERGQSLVLALVVMSALTITIGALADLTTGTEHSMGRDRQDLRTFAVAESGISDAIAVISDPSYDGSDTKGPGTVLGPTALDTGIDGATGSYSATKYSAADCSPVNGGVSQNPCWVIKSTATSSDGKVTRSLQETIYYNESISDVSGVYGYGLFIDNGTGDCVKTSGSPDMVVDYVYISGCFQPKGSAFIHPATTNTGTAEVNGQFDPSGGASLGTPAAMYSVAHMPGGCTGGTCGLAGSNVYATKTDGVTIPLQRPAMLPVPLYTYGKSEGQPGDPTVVSWDTHDTPANGGICNVPDAFQMDNNGAPDRSVTGAQLMPAGNEDFRCTVIDNLGNTVGSISRTNGVVDIEGTLFVDGDLNINTDGKYIGKGTIYVNGVVTGQGAGTLDICGPQIPGTYAVSIDHPCDQTHTKIWDRGSGELVIAVINPFGNPSAFRIDAQGELDASVVVNKGYTDIGGVVVAGSVVADNATISGSSGLVPPSGGAIQSAPTKVITITGWTEQPGSWKQNN
jgi:hypothetical protein